MCARAQSVEESAADPELADWKVLTRKRYDADGNFVITITTRPEYAPVIEAGLDAKRAELQRELDAQNMEQAERPSVAPEQEKAGAPDVPAGTPAAAAPSAGDAYLDAQAPGWPQGTTLRQIRETSAAFTDRWAGTSLTETETETERPITPSRTAEPSAPAASGAAPDVPAGTPAHPPATDGEALAAEKAAQPDVVRHRRPQLTAQIDPLSGWGRQADGELLTLQPARCHEDPPRPGRPHPAGAGHRPRPAPPRPRPLLAHGQRRAARAARHPRRRPTLG